MQQTDKVPDKIVLLDYGMGNHTSIINALVYLGCQPTVSSSISDLGKANKIILPGVGAFAEAMYKINKMHGLSEFIQDFAVNQNKPLLGICLGMQLLANYSLEHGLNKGLGLIPGEVLPFPKDINIKVPHVGWNNVKVKNKNEDIVHQIKDGDDFYFVHSYYFKVKNTEHEVCSTDYGVEFSSIVKKNNIIGVQFHPEKSQKCGLQLLKNFILI